MNFEYYNQLDKEINKVMGRVPDFGLDTRDPEDTFTSGVLAGLELARTLYEVAEGRLE